MDGLILTAAGSSVRFQGATPKVFVDLGGTPVLLRALAPFRAALPWLSVVVTARPEDLPRARALLPGVVVVAGGATRQASVHAGLKALPPQVDLVLVHDAARPLLTADLVRRVATAARAHGAAVAGLPVSDSLHALSEDGARLLRAVPRQGLFAAQTPQAARRDWLVEALERAEREGRTATDEAELLLAAGHPVVPVAGEAHNLKITRPEDLAAAAALLTLLAPAPTRPHGPTPP